MALRRNLMALVLMATPVLAGSSLWAQSLTIPTEATMSTTALTPQQQGAVNQYVNQSVEQLLSGDATQVTQGRNRLLNIFALPGVTDMFMASYSPAISRELISRNAMEHESTLVRTNTMIVAGRLSDGGVVSLIREGLADANPAVRYWAAIAAGQAGAKLSPADQNAILSLLVSHWEKETAIEVLEKQLLALEALRTPAATPQLLQALNQRVNIHAGNPALPIKAEFEALQGVTVRTFSALTSTSQSVDPQVLKPLVITMFRYFDLATTLLAQGESAAKQDDLHRLTLLSGNYLPRLASRLDLTLATRQIKPSDVNANRLLAEEWRRALTTGSAGITAADLAITPAKEEAKP